MGWCGELGESGGRSSVEERKDHPEPHSNLGTALRVSIDLIRMFRPLGMLEGSSQLTVLDRLEATGFEQAPGNVLSEVAEPEG